MAREHAVRMVGIDVSARWLDVVCGAADEADRARQFANTAAGHRELERWVTRGGRRARVVLEATGLYSLDVALALHRSRRTEVMVVNPRASKDFARAYGQRACTDATAAASLRQFAARMPFTPWQPPRAAALALRTIMRRVVALVEMRVQEANRLHALASTAALPVVIRRDLDAHARELTRRIRRLEQEARTLVESAPALRTAYGHLRSVPGIAQRSALLILSELVVLPAELDVRQWVAHAGLDPRPIRSGTSVHPPVRISKRGNVYLRRALYMPALVAVRRDPAVQRFAHALTARGKAPKQVLVAVMSKRLHAIYGMLRTDTDYDREKFRCSAA
jgi:transposase